MDFTFLCMKNDTSFCRLFIYLLLLWHALLKNSLGHSEKGFLLSGQNQAETSGMRKIANSENT